MLPPLIHLLTAQPHLLLNHAQAYADLFGAEAQGLSATWTRRVLWSAAALLSAAVSAVLAGVALMLGAVQPGLSEAQRWVLVVTPLVPLLLSLACAWLASRQCKHPFFGDLRRQLQTDWIMLNASSP